RTPSRSPPASCCADLVLNLDLAQTFLDYAAVAAPERMQGRSLRTLCCGSRPDDWRDHIYYRYWEHLGEGVGAHVGIRTRRHKLIHYYGQALGVPGAIDEPRDPEWELFDLEADPAELHSVYTDPEYASVRAELTSMLMRSIAESGDVPPPSLAR